MTLAGELRIGDQFYVEPEGADPIPAELLAPGGWWGLVHGEMILPILRLDTLDHTTVSIHRTAQVRLVT